MKSKIIENVINYLQKEIYIYTSLFMMAAEWNLLVSEIIIQTPTIYFFYL